MWISCLHPMAKTKKFYSLFGEYSVITYGSTNRSVLVHKGQVIHSDKDYSNLEEPSVRQEIIKLFKLKKKK